MNKPFSFSSLAIVFLGNLLYALTMKLFLLPAGLVMGGTTGIALSLNHFTGLSLSSFILIFNVLMLIAGYLVLGKAFAMTTLASSFLYPFFLDILDRLLGNLLLTNDILLNTLFSGFGIGLALGLIIRSGSSTGGVDIPLLILQKYTHIPVSVSLYVFDLCVLIPQMFFRPIENVLYGILLVLIYSVMLNKTLLIGTSKTEVKIVSQQASAISEAILGQVDRGVTFLHGEGGYLHHPTEVILSVLSNRELPIVNRIVRDIDPEAFLVITEVKEVHGRGFSLKKFHLLK